MSAPKPPEEFLIDAFQYCEVQGEASWGETIYAEPVDIQVCRIDRESRYTFDGTGRHLLYNAVIFCYTGMSTPMPGFKEMSKIIFDEKEHILTKVVPIYEPYTKELYSYELEVV
ncbi:hypothetical protein M2454_001903 [Aequitasia blattaphilus]|uniref:Minor capsid protein n=1 Tax=Aequitasia blattaphilus TaxID=2949332 RepID=A0ABT1ECM2_9FIRM|nr:minor capsid protein [Aequitasia blattaphilus]MCP1102591.1 minor capsid protein [Aequitasia blattaphilus]MCR8615231.1 minor capsid protein [Aequitasia blattaphilus]